MRALKYLWLLAFAPAAFAQVSVQNLPSGSAIAGANYTVCDQSAVTNKCTFTQVGTYALGVTLNTANTWGALQSFPANDISIAGTTITGVTGTGSNVLATSPTLVTPNLGTPSAAVLTNATGTATALNIGGTAANLSGTPALPNGTTATTQTAADNTTKIATDAFVLANAGSAGVASAAAGQGIAITGTGTGPYTGAITVSTNVPHRTVTTSPTVTATDMGGVIYSNVTGGGTVTIPAISSTVLASGMSLSLVNYSASTAAISTTPTVNAGGGCVSGTGIPAGETWEIVSNGTTLDCNQTVNSASGGSSAWSGLSNPSANLTLSMAAFTSTFNQTSAANWIWANTTAATSGSVGDSPILNLNSTYWTGSVSATDSWSLQNVLATGANGASTLTFTHTGSTGTAALSVPELDVVSGANASRFYQSGTNTYISPVPGGALRLQNGSADVMTISNNGGSGVGASFNYAQAINSPQTTLSGTSAGSVIWTQPHQGTAFNIVMLDVAGYENTTATAQTITFNTAYGTVDAVVTDSGSCAGITVSLTKVTLPASMGATQTGLCEVRGF